MDKSEARELAIINGIFADDSPNDDSSDSDYEPVEKVCSDKIRIYLECL